MTALTESGISRAIQDILNHVLESGLTPTDAVRARFETVMTWLSLNEQRQLMGEALARRVGDALHSIRAHGYSHDEDSQPDGRRLLVRARRAESPAAVPAVLVNVCYATEAREVKPLYRFSADDFSYLASMAEEKAAGWTAVAEFAAWAMVVLREHAAATVECLPAEVLTEVAGRAEKVWAT